MPPWRPSGPAATRSAPGAIGSTHIPIAPPRDNPDHYLNRRGWHSVVLQAVVDHNACFTDVYAGWPGGTSSAAVLSSSDLYLKAEAVQDGTCYLTGESYTLYTCSPDR
ncbi:putative nuclease HARBI1 [Perca flavescens]|uniref:putative nuclease HARBI1 n=1 Tax=Perca flavescens TaxID=8167 RepID=UPI00106E4C1C|nr:putative nuclease HARBI1 [Perca flavescens]